MKLILKNGKVTMGTKGYVPKEALECDVLGITPGSTAFVKLGKLPKQKVKNNKVTIPKELLKKDITIIFDVSNEKDNFKETYKSDKINIEEAVLIGGDPAKAFPASLETCKGIQNNLVRDYYKLLKRVERLEEEVVDIKERGDLI